MKFATKSEISDVGRLSCVLFDLVEHQLYEMSDG